MVFSAILPASAFSGIFNVNGWNVDQLKEAGITIKPWANDEGRDIPAMRWVEIAYDWKKMGEHRHVEMTLYSGQKDFNVASLCRAEHRKGQTDPMKLLFAIPKENIENCYIWIIFPEDGNEASEQPEALGLGNGPQGYSLDASRIIQLAGGKPEEKAGAMNGNLPGTEEKADAKEVQAQQSFDMLAPMLAKIPAEAVPAIFEGLPHPLNQRELLAAELQTKANVSRHGFPFYKFPAEPDAGDRKKLITLVKAVESFRMIRGKKLCEGFRPDFSLVWALDEGEIDIHVCFGCEEIKAYHGDTAVHCEISEGTFAVLKPILEKYHSLHPDHREPQTKD